MSITRPISLVLALALATLGLTAASAQAWTPVPRSALLVTSGEITIAGSGLRTRSAEVRAVAQDEGHHARSALLRFSYRRASRETAPLGSGEIRRQIGLKLRAGDPCNLLYVMWREFPEHTIVVSVKRNPGQTTSAACGNRGYTDIARIPLGPSASTRDHHTHRLEARTRAHADGTLGVTVVADRRTVLNRTVPADLAGGLAGPIGVRSDNGDYRFSLSASRPARR